MMTSRKTRFHFRIAIFDTFGGLSESANELLRSYTKRVADRQGTTLNRVLGCVYEILSLSNLEFQHPSSRST